MKMKLFFLAILLLHLHTENIYAQLLGQNGIDSTIVKRFDELLLITLPDQKKQKFQSLVKDIFLKSDQTNQPKQLIYIADKIFFQGSKTGKVSFTLEALEYIVQHTGQEESYSKIFNYLGIIYGMKDEIVPATKNFIIASQLSQKIEEKTNSLINLSLLQIAYYDYSQALQNLELAKSIIITSGNEQIKYNNICFINAKMCLIPSIQNDHLWYKNLILEIQKNIPLVQRIDYKMTAYLTVLEYMLTYGITTEIHACFKKIDTLLPKLKNQTLLNYYYLHKVEHLVIEGDLKNAEYLFKSIKYLDQDRYRRSYKEIEIKLFEALGNFKKAFDVQSELLQLNEKIRHVQTTKQSMFFESKFQNERLILENKIQNGKLTSEQNMKRFLLVISLLFLVLIIIILRSFLQKREHEKQLLELNKRLKEANTDISHINNELEVQLKVKLLSLSNDLSVFKKINDLLQQKSNEDSQSLTKKIKRLVENRNRHEVWKSLDREFSSLHRNFYDELTAIAPSLTPNNLKMCTLVKLGFSSKEIAELTAISPDSVKVAKSRIKKKLHLTDSSQSLFTYLSSIGRKS